MSAGRIPGMDAIDVCARLRAACRDAGGQSAFAAAGGVSAQYVNDVMAGRRDAGESILRALGLRRIVRYVEIRATPDMGMPE